MISHTSKNHYKDGVTLYVIYFAISLSSLIAYSNIINLFSFIAFCIFLHVLPIYVLNVLAAPVDHVRLLGLLVFL